MIFVCLGTAAVLLLCPVFALICFLTPWRGFRAGRVTHRHRHYATMHLSTFDRVGRLDRQQATRFHQSFLSTLKEMLHETDNPIFFTSHLLRPVHLRSMKTLLARETPDRRWRKRFVHISRVVRVGIQLQMLLQEWRWIIVPDTGVLVVIAPKRNSSCPKKSLQIK